MRAGQRCDQHGRKGLYFQPDSILLDFLGTLILRSIWRLDAQLHDKLGPSLDVFVFQSRDQAKQGVRTESLAVTLGRRTKTFLQLAGIDSCRDRWITVHNELNISIIDRVVIDFSHR